MKKNETQQKKVVSKRKSPIPFLLFLVLMAALGAAGGYYYKQSLKPKMAVDEFMQSIQTLDFDKMSSMIQSEDLSVLNKTDIRNEAFTDFFRSKCEKMTYKIVKNDFDFTAGTSDVTVRINYVDGTDIYRTGTADFLRNIAAASIKNSSKSDNEVDQSLAAAFQAASENIEDTFLITEITYPMVAIDGKWKVVRLDEESIRVMSSNFTGVKKDMEEAIASAQAGQNVSLDAPVDEHDVIDMENEHFRIHYTQTRISNDIAGKPCLMVYYEYTNLSTEASCPMIDVRLQAYQNGGVLEGAIPETTEDALDQFMSEVAPQQTVQVCQAFSLNGGADVTLKASDAFSFNTSETTAQIVKVQ